MPNNADHIPAAAACFNRAVAAIGKEQLAAPTPCADYDVRALLNHVLYWSPVLEAGANGAAPPADRPPNTAPTERDVNLVGADWRATLDTRVTALVEAWSRPESWAGTAEWISGDIPAQTLGTMTLVDLTVHGWDLARALEIDYAVPDGLAEALWQAASAIGEQGRAIGAFGPEITVAGDTRPFERALGAFGRDPAWRP